MSDTTVHFLGRCSSCEYAAHTPADQTQHADRYRDMETPGVPYAMGAQVYVSRQGKPVLEFA